MRIEKVNQAKMKKAPANCDESAVTGQHCLALYMIDDHESPVKSWIIVRELSGRVLKLDRVRESMRFPNK